MKNYGITLIRGNYATSGRQSNFDHCIFVFDNFQLCGKCFGRSNHLKRHTDGVHKNIATQNVDANLSNDAFNVENLQVESSIEFFNCVPATIEKPRSTPTSTKKCLFLFLKETFLES